MQWTAARRKDRAFADGFANGQFRPVSALQYRPDERARSAGKRSLAEDVGYAMSELRDCAAKAPAGYPCSGRLGLDII